MRPTKFLDGDHNQQLKSGIVINGPRPTPLKLKQESHTIHKRNQQHQQIRKPIIIYLNSPEIIHTKPHDFMALVQNLTGKNSGSKDDQKKKKKKTLKQEGYDLNETELSNDSGVIHERDKGMKSKSPLFNTPSNPYVADIPLFTPSSFSPGALLEFMKELPEY